MGQGAGRRGDRGWCRIASRADRAREHLSDRRDSRHDKGRRESLFDEIVEFAGIGPFLETPAKRYSTGMHLRLAFAIAAHIQPPIVVLDEVLAVGDARFRESCLQKIRELEGRGRTILFASHDLGAISRLCDRVLWLEGGSIVGQGRPSEVVPAYLKSTEQPVLETRLPVGRTVASVTSVTVRDSDGSVLASLRRDQPFLIEVAFVVSQQVPGLDLSVWLLDETGALVIHDVYSEHFADSPARPGAYVAKASIPAVLAAHRYVLGVWLGTDSETFFDGEVFGLSVGPHPDDGPDSVERRRALQPDVDWTLQRDDAGRPAT